MRMYHRLRNKSVVIKFIKFVKFLKNTLSALSERSGDPALAVMWFMIPDGTIAIAFCVISLYITDNSKIRQ